MIDTQSSPNAVRYGNRMDLHQVFKVLKKRQILIISITLLCAIIAGLASFYVLQPVYEAESLLMVTVASDKLQTQTTVTRQVSQNSQGATVTNLAPMPVLTMSTYLGQLKSEEVMKRVLDNMSLPGQNIPSLSGMVEASIVQDSNLIELKVRNNNPVLAAQVANSVSAQYLKLMDELMFSSVVVISPANVPSTPVSPNKKLNVEIAFLFGLMISILLAFLLEYLDNTLKTADDVNQYLSLPVLGLIPLKTDQNIRQNT